MKLFGFELNTDTKKKVQELNTFDIHNAIDPDALNTSVPYGDTSIIDYSGASVPQEEVEKIKTYRTISKSAEIDQALVEIFNEVFIFDVDNKKAFDIGFYDDCKIPEKIRKLISQEVSNLYKITNFHHVGSEWFADWYIDSRFNLQAIIDEDQPKKGIQKTLQVDPLKLRKVRLIPQPDRTTGATDLNAIEEFFIYANTFESKYHYDRVTEIYNPTQLFGMKISPDAIIQVMSGLKDAEDEKTVGYLHKSIVPYHNLKMMEESMVIFRVVRAPMRRAFYVDVSKLPPGRGEAYLNETKKRFKSKLVYNSKTGTFNNSSHINSMMEDYFLPRMSEGRTTEIQNLDGQSSQEILEEVEYARDKLWRALNIPLSRLQEQASFAFGKTIEIQRDEHRFKKFLNKLRGKFMVVFDELLKRQLILKNIIKPEEWEDFKNSYYWTFSEDNSFVEWKETEILSSRLDLLDRMNQYVNIYFSEDYIKEHILKQSEATIKAISDQNIKNPPAQEEEPNENEE